MSLPPDLALPLIDLIIAGTLLGFLRVVGFAYYNHVMWHNLKIEVHELRIKQQQKLLELALGELTDRDDSTMGDVEVAGTITPETAADAAPAQEAA